jgi:hypothetical protein
MLKQLSILIILSILLLVFSSQIQMLLTYLDASHHFLNVKLSFIFNTSPAGNIVQEVLCLLLIPVIIASVPAAIYFLIKRKFMPYFFHVLWSAWLVLFTSLSVMR